jgi:hypothetical protein
MPSPGEMDPTLDPNSDLGIINQTDTTPEENNNEEIESIVKSIVNQIDIQERPSRQVLIKLWKYLDLLWHGISNFYWNTAANEWRVITQDDIRNLGDSVDVDSALLNKTVNLIRPYGESLIGVLTTGTPRVKFFPADADKVEDIRTAKVSSILEKRISEDNNMKARIIEILVRLWNNGFAAIYNYSHKSPDYGIVSKPIMGNVTYNENTSLCPECGYEFSNERVKKDIEEPTPDKGEDVQASPVEILDLPPSTEEEEFAESSSPCPQCGNQVTPFQVQGDDEVVEEQIGQVDLPKAKQILKVYGPLNIKIPVKASCKEEVIYLIMEEELHESLARTLYPDYWDDIRGGDQTSDLGWDRWARSQYENMAETTQFYVTMRKVWLRPSAYNIIGDQEQADLLREEYPKGLVAIFAGDRFLYCEESELDNHWTLSFNPMYYRVYGDPLAKAAIPLQETANDIFQLEVETLRYSIPQTWVDPQFVDLEAYSKSKAVPGGMYALKSGVSAGKPISDIFYETKPATLPKEAEELDQKVNQLFQFVTGILPPVFGGTQAGGSKTLGEVEQNRNQALQRLQTVWYIITMMYAECMTKSVKAYRDELLEDEHVVEARGDSFINTWVRMTDVTGNVGKVVPEYGDQFPITWAQKKAALMELINLNNDMINSYLMHPENIEAISDYIVGVDGLYIPGEDQRNKELLEIAKIVSMQPPSEEEIQMMGGIPPQPIPPQIEAIDDPGIHLAVLEAYICSDQGQELKDTNQLAYQSLMLRVQAFQFMIQQAQMAQMQAEAAQKPDPNASKEVSKTNG